MAKAPLLFLIITSFLLGIGIGATFFFSARRSTENENSIRVIPFTETTIFDLALSNQDTSEETPPESTVIIVPHHLLAARLIAQTLLPRATEQPITIVLIGPDHFETGKQGISTSLSDWKTPYGVVEADSERISVLAQATDLNIDEPPFETEHGIYNLLPFIKKIFPHARIVPIIIKTHLRDELADVFARDLEQYLPDDTLVIASLDFSHEVTSEVADEQDAASINILSSSDFTRASKVAVDCQACIRILLQYARFRDMKQFHLITNTNAAKLLERPDMQDVTSYIVGYFGKE